MGGDVVEKGMFRERHETIPSGVFQDRQEIVSPVLKRMQRLTT
jgi:hypothetical protein